MELPTIVMIKITIQPNFVDKERSKSAPAAQAEIRLRAFEIHVERGGIHRLALGTWQKAYANFIRSSKTRKDKQTANEMRHRDDIEIREGNSVKSSSLFAWYHILRTQYHWTVFQAIRYALWLAR